MKTYIITGATSGLGLSTAKALADESKNRLILAVRDVNKGEIIAKELGANTKVMKLDLNDMRSVDEFVASWDGPLHGLINNAGVQIVNETRYTKSEGLEETFAVNHLAALKLTLGLIPFMKQSRVLFIGSGTHNPNNYMATLFGFRGAQYKSIEQCAEGWSDTTSIKQMGMDRYATSKFLNTVITLQLSKQYSSDHVAFFCIDPGMMPGAGLARTESMPLQWVWKYCLPVIAKILPDASTPARSGRVASWIMTSETLHQKTGEIFSYNFKPSKQVWNKVFDVELGKEVLNDSVSLIERVGRDNNKSMLI